MRLTAEGTTMGSSHSDPRLREEFWVISSAVPRFHPSVHTSALYPFPASVLPTHAHQRLNMECSRSVEPDGETSAGAR